MFKVMGKKDLIFWGLCNFGGGEMLILVNIRHPQINELTERFGLAWDNVCNFASLLFKG